MRKEFYLIGVSLFLMIPFYFISFYIEHIFTYTLHNIIAQNSGGYTLSEILSDFDLGIISFLPLIAAVICLMLDIKNLKAYFIIFVWVCLAIILSVFIGVLIALYSWTITLVNFNVIGDKILYKPFSLYFTLFIVAAILCPFIIWKVSKSNRLKKFKSVQNDNLDINV